MSKTKKNNIIYLKIILLIITFILSYYGTFDIIEKYPKIVLATEREYNNASITLSPYDDNLWCTEIQEITLYPDETRVNDGDPLELKINYTKSDDNSKENLYFLQAGVGKEDLHKLKEGENKFGPFYYKYGKTKVYIQYCQKEFDLSNNKSNSIVGLTLERPSFIDSKTGTILVFIATFILFGEFFRLVLYFLSKE